MKHHKEVEEVALERRGKHDFMISSLGRRSQSLFIVRTLHFSSEVKILFVIITIYSTARLLCKYTKNCLYDRIEYLYAIYAKIYIKKINIVKLSRTIGTSFCV